MCFSAKLLYNANNVSYCKKSPPAWFITFFLLLHNIIQSHISLILFPLSSLHIIYASCWQCSSLRASCAQSIIAFPFSTDRISILKKPGDTVRPLCAACLPVMGINSSGRARDMRGDGRGQTGRRRTARTRPRWPVN